MPNCAVPGCTSGYRSNHERVHFFQIPNDPIVAKQWIKLIHRDSSEIKSRKYVCEHHFPKSHIMWQREITDPTGRVLGVSTYKVPRLRPGTVPAIFPWDDVCAITEAECTLELSDDKTFVSTTMPSGEIHDPSKILSHELEQPEQPVNSEGNDSTNHEIEVDARDLDSLSLTVLDAGNAASSETKKIGISSCPLPSADVFNTKLSLPSGWITHNSELQGSRMLSLYTLRTTNFGGKFRLLMGKSVTITDTMSVQISAYDRDVNQLELDLPQRIESIESLENLILTIDRLYVCTGFIVKEEMQNIYCNILKKDDAGSYHHIKCIGLVQSSTTVCRFCRTGKKTLADKTRRWKRISQRSKVPKTFTPTNRKEWVKLQDRYRKSMRVKREAQKKNKTLKSKFQEVRSEMARTTANDFEQLIKDGKIKENQQHTLRAIINSAKRSSSKGRRYTEEWILLCMLFHMRSPSAYNFLLTNGILPLPAVRSIRRYLSKIKATCGFDTQFFEVLRVALEKRDELSRHGILLLDEISTRESVTVDTNNLTYRGLINFGEDGEQSKDLTDKANHCLVLMFQSLSDLNTQPIAVFASKGTVKGTVLAKLVVKAIALMEGIGAKIHGVVSDGASSNRKFWSLLGVNPSKSELRNYFEHPTVKDRRVYVFSDPPHLIKTIRNCFHKNRVLQMDSKGPQIKWEYIENLHAVDQRTAGPGQALVCPKLTKDHIYLNNSLKMRVRLATQVFSNSVAAGLKFYEGRDPVLKGCEATADFCKWMNDLFDALNRTDATYGVKPGNNDIKQIEQSLQKLDVWEEEVRANKLSKNLFLTKQTAEGLRVTLKSMLDLVSYLTKHCGFTYVLTGRINQDPLEKFFGTARQAGGCNDHPSTPTFLQLYKILSTYSVLKPPKKGNCSVTSDDAPAPLLTLGELKRIFNNSPDSAGASRNFKEKLDRIIQREDWELEIAGDHNYSQPEVRNCVLYCLTADLTKRICNTVQCLVCKEALVRPETNGVVLPESVLAQWQRTDGLVHPNSNLYRFVLFLETQFEKYCNSTNVFEELLHEVMNFKNLTFPCTAHAHEVISQLTISFVRMRMQQYCTRLNAESQKMNQLKKKVSKFCTT